MKEKRKGPIGRAAGLAEGVAATVRRMQREREPRLLVYDETGYARLVQPNGRGYERLQETAEKMVALVSQAEADAKPRMTRRTDKAEEAKPRGARQTAKDEDSKTPRARRTGGASETKKPRARRTESGGAKKSRARSTDDAKESKPRRARPAKGAAGATKPRRPRRSAPKDDP